MTDKALIIALLLSAIMIVLICMYFYFRSGINPCVHGISSKCNMYTMDEYCLHDGRLDVCMKFCRYVITNNLLDSSKYCTDPVTYSAGARLYRSQNNK